MPEHVEGDVMQDDAEGVQPMGAQEMDGDSAPTAARYSAHFKCVRQVHKLLDVKRYQRRWPKLPKHELYASSVQHPHVPEWRWVLHTKRLRRMWGGYVSI